MSYSSVDRNLSSSIESNMDQQAETTALQLKSLVTSTGTKIFAVLSMITAFSAIGCDKEIPKPIEPVQTVEPEVEQLPSKEEVRRAEVSIMKLIKQFMQTKMQIEFPTVPLHLSRTQDDYIQAASGAKRAFGLNSYGFHSKGEIWINAKYSEELIKLSRAVDGDSTNSIECPTVVAASIILHELAHSLTKDKKHNKYGDYHNFTRSMHEALASETATLAPQFINMVIPNASVSTNCESEPIRVTTINNRYTVNKKYGVYPNEVTFESYLFALTGECEPESEIPSGSWAICSLNALMTKTFNQVGASFFMKEIMKRNPKCNSTKFRGQIDAAIMYADAPYLQYAISQCDGGEKIPDVACTKIQMLKSGDPKIMDSLTLVGEYPDGKWSQWKHTFTNLDHGVIYDLEPDKPLRFRDGIFPRKQTMPEYSSTFSRPHNSDDPCTIEFKQNYYCDNFQLSGFDSDAALYLLVRMDGKEYLSGTYQEDEIINSPLLEGAEVYVNRGNNHLKPWNLEITGKKDCVISPKSN